jgi:hypothetical protein
MLIVYSFIGQATGNVPKYVFIKTTDIVITLSTTDSNKKEAL